MAASIPEILEKEPRSEKNCALTVSRKYTCTDLRQQVRPFEGGGYDVGAFSGTSSAKWHADQWPGMISRSGGSSLEQTGCAMKQRG